MRDEAARRFGIRFSQSRARIITAKNIFEFDRPIRKRGLGRRRARALKGNRAEASMMKMYVTQNAGSDCASERARGNSAWMSRCRAGYTSGRQNAIASARRGADAAPPTFMQQFCAPARASCLDYFIARD